MAKKKLTIKPKTKLPKAGNGLNTPIKNPITDSYYTPSSSDKKLEEKIYNENIQKQNDLRLIQSLQEKNRDKYEPTQAIKNAKAVAAIGQFSPEPLSNLGAKTVGTVWDLGTATKYALDGQYKNAGEDLIQAGVNWIPFLNQKKMLNLSKNTPSLAYQFNQAIPTINKGINYFQKGNDVKTTTEAFKFGGQIQNKLDMAKNGKKIKMKLKKADVGNYINEDPTFNVGDQGYNENIQMQGNQLGQMLNVEPSVFNPSLTYSLEQHNNKKGVKSNPYLNPQEQDQYSQYKNNQKNQFNPSSFIPTQGLFNNFYLNKADRYRKQAINSFSNIGQAKYGKQIPQAEFGFNNGMNLGSGISNAVLADINTAKGYTDIFGSLKMNSQIAQIEAQNKRQNLISQFENPTPTFQNGWGGNNALDNGYIPVGEYGMSVKAIGGKGQPNIEVEGQEHIQLPNGFSEEIQGDSHAEGGIPLNLPQDSKVFSEKLKHPEMKKSYAKLAKKFETKKDFKQLENPISSKLNKSTAELNIKLKNEGLDELFMEQEMNKIEGFHGKIPQKETLQDYQMKNGGSVLPETAKIGKLTGKKARIKAFQEAMLNQQNNTNQPQGDEQYYGQNTINPAVSQTTNVQQPVNTIQNNAPIVNSIPPSLFKTFDTKFNKKTMDTGYDVTTDPPTESDWQNTIIPSWYNYEEGNLPYLTNSSNQKFSDKIPKNLQTNEALLQEVEYDSILDRLDPKQNYTKEERDAALSQMKNVWGKIGRVSFNNGKNYKKPNVNSWKSGDEATYKELAELRGNFIDSKLEKRYFTPISNPQKPPSKTQPAVQQSSTPGTIPSLQAEKLNRLKGFNPNITALQLPDAYVKDPITVNNLQPEFYQPNTITPYLNDIQRLQYATNTNLGTSGADLASRANSFGQGLTEYGKRYYDASTYNAGVKTQAAKDNALTKLNTNQFNNSNYINNARNPQLQREAVITEQKRMDREAQLKTFADKEHEQNVNNYLQNIYDPNYALNANFSNPYGLKSTNAESEEAKKAKAYETLYGKKKYGGKLKLKPKKKK